MVNNKISGMEQTAVEWLIDKVLQTNHLKAIFEDEINQAKEMEQKQKQEIRQKSYMDGYDEGLHDALNK